MKKILALFVVLLAWAAPAYAQSSPYVIVLEGPITSSANCTVQRNAGDTAWVCTAPSAASQPLTDSSGLIADNVDPTKVLFFQLSGLTTATNRTWTIPDANITFPTTIASLAGNTFTGSQVMNGGFTATTGSLSSTLAVTGTITAANDILAATNGNLDIGKTGARFAQGWINNITSSGTFAGGVGTFSSTLTVTSQTTANSFRATGGYVTDAANQCHLAGATGGGYVLCQGTGASSVGSFNVYLTESDGGAFTVATTLNATEAIVPAVYSATSASAANVFVDSSGKLYRSTSSLRYKADPQPFTGSVADLQKLQPISFLSNSDLNGPRHIGFSAEALDAAGFYNVVLYDDQGRPDAIQYDRLTTYLVNAVKELAAEIDALRGNPVQRVALSPDKASRSKAISKETEIAKVRQADKTKLDKEREARDIRARLTACDADNAIIEAQGGKPETCEKNAEDKAERKAMNDERAKLAKDEDAKLQRELAQCLKRNEKIVATGGKPIVCGSPAPITQKERLQ